MRLLVFLGLLVSVACAPRETPHAAPAGAARVVTLGPSFTEIAWLLGAGDRLVGRSRWDRLPAGVERIAEVGDAIQPSVERIVAARPDLVLMYAAVDNAPAIAALERAGIRVVSLRVDRIADYLAALDTLGGLLAEPARADSLRATLEATLDSVRRLPAPSRRLRVFDPVWMQPSMTVGSGSFISELMELAGADNVYADRAEPSFTVSFEDVLQRNPDLVLTSPAGRQRLLEVRPWGSLRAVQAGRWLTLDTLRMSQPSSRMGEAAAALAAEVRAFAR